MLLIIMAIFINGQYMQQLLRLWIFRNIYLVLRMLNWYWNYFSQCQHLDGYCVESMMPRAQCLWMYERYVFFTNISKLSHRWTVLQSCDWKVFWVNKWEFIILVFSCVCELWKVLSKGKNFCALMKKVRGPQPYFVCILDIVVVT